MRKMLELNGKTEIVSFFVILRLQFHSFAFRLRLYGAAYALP